MATCSPEEVDEHREPNQSVIFQVGSSPHFCWLDSEVPFLELYVHPDRKKSEDMVKKVEKLGYKGIMLTVDTTILGKRENDMRAKALSTVSTVHSPS